MGLQGMGRPLDKHVDERELDALVPSSCEKNRHQLFPDAVGEAERHVDSCAFCRRKVEKYRQLVNGLSDAVGSGVGPRAECSVGQDVDWYEVAAGLWPELKAQQLILHAALCDQCGPLLRDAAAVADDVTTPEEEKLLAELRAPVRPEVRSTRRVIPARPAPAWGRVLLWKLFVPAVALLVIAGLFATKSPPSQKPLSGPKFAAFAVSAHRQHAQGHLALDVGSDSPRALHDWFQSKPQFSLAVPTFPAMPGDDQLYRVEGARLIQVDGKSAAYIAYRMQSGLVSLLVAPDSVALASGGLEVDFAKVNFHYATVDGYKAVTWSVHGLTYALISQEGNRTQRSCMVCHSGMGDRELSQTPTPLRDEGTEAEPMWQ
jgi:anti-sigma factor RsiW